MIFKADVEEYLLPVKTMIMNIRKRFKYTL